MKQLKCGTSPGVDGISAEHLKCAVNTNLPTYLSILLTLCVRFGLVPDTFRTGVLVPIVKKSNLHSCDAASYKPINIFVTFSKLLEYYILEEISKEYQSSKYQFGFISDRSTQMATSLIQDVGLFCNKQGSSIFTCSLDAEGTYDAIPHSVLLDCQFALPNHCWRMMYNWYTNLNILISSGATISVHLFLFLGIFARADWPHQPYVICFNKLCESNLGVIISNRKCNTLCFADDVILMSTTVTELQSLINTAVEYITDRGLRFNPQKQNVSFGEKSICEDPRGVHW